MSSPSNGITEVVSRIPDIPTSVQIGDFVVARYKNSQWSRYLPWEKWDHVALVSQLNPLKVIEVTGILLQDDDNEIREGVVEYEFRKQRTVTLLDRSRNKNGNLWLLDGLLEIKWLRPIFPNPIREIDKWYVRRSKRTILSEEDARRRVVQYAKRQLGEPYSITASKWDENKWYCSLLIYKGYSRTITGMYLESYGNPSNFRAGPMVTPEDLVDSPHSEIYHVWKRQS